MSHWNQNFDYSARLSALPHSSSLFLCAVAHLCACTATHRPVPLNMTRTTKKFIVRYGTRQHNRQPNLKAKKKRKNPSDNNRTSPQKPKCLLFRLHFYLILFSPPLVSSRSFSSRLFVPASFLSHSSRAVQTTIKWAKRSEKIQNRKAIRQVG